MSPRKILLLNPTAPSNSLRDYYCPGLAKSNYYYHPVDLLYLSGRLVSRYDVRVLDAPPRRLTREEVFALSRILEKRFYLRPAYILKMLAAMRTWAELRIFVKSGLGVVFKQPS